MAEIRIGTSGYHYNHWRGTFYPEKLPQKQWLSYYLEHFDTVELNNTFYRLPTFEAMNAWRENTPENFLFAVKGSRFITHNLKLSRPENAIQNILPRAETLGKKLGTADFRARAPEDVVAEQERRMAEESERVRRLKDALDTLAASGGGA